MEVTSNIATADATKNPKAALSSLPEVNFYHTGKRLYLDKLFILYYINGAKTDRLYPSEPFENKNDDSERRIEKRMSDVNSFNSSINNIKEMIPYFKDKNNKSKKKYKILKTTTILKSFDTIVIIATTSISTTLSLTGIGLIATPISSATACGLSIGIKVVYEKIIS